MDKIRVARGQVGKTPGLDVTFKSGQGTALRFAPYRGFVLEHKRGLMSWEEFRRQYVSCTLGTVLPEEWAWLEAQGRAAGRLVLLCYCPPSKPECHTQILLEELLARYPQVYTIL